MIKKFNIFNRKTGLQKGIMFPADYSISNFVNNNVGKFLRKFANYQTIIIYNRIPKELEIFFHNKNGKYYQEFSINDIKFHSKNKEDCEVYLQTKNYNL